ncbi:MAG: hypothetical protein RLZZ157_1797, partial [Pseudomonadota bacterium]
MDATTRIQLAHSQIASDNIRVTGFGAFGPDIEASDIAQGMSALLILKDGALVGAIELPRVGRVDLPYGNKAFGLCHFVHRKVVIDTITG